jgi:hypothetical protein
MSSVHISSGNNWDREGEKMLYFLMKNHLEFIRMNCTNALKLKGV